MIGTIRNRKSSAKVLYNGSLFESLGQKHNNNLSAICGLLLGNLRWFFSPLNLPSIDRVSTGQPFLVSAVFSGPPNSSISRQLTSRYSWARVP